MAKEFKNTLGEEFTQEEMADRMLSYYNRNKGKEYKIFIGSDSQRHKKRKIVYVTAVVMWRTYKDAIMFYKKDVEKHNGYIDLSTRILREVADSIKVTQFVENTDIIKILGKDCIEVHVDAGTTGDSNKILSSAMGWVTGMGYNAKSKPNAMAASSIADKFTK